MITIVNGVYLWMPYVLPTGKRLTSGYSVFSASQQREGWVIGIGCGQRRSQNKIWGLGFRVWDFVVPLIFGLFYEFLSFYNTKGFIGGDWTQNPLDICMVVDSPSTECSLIWQDDVVSNVKWFVLSPCRNTVFPPIYCPNLGHARRSSSTLTRINKSCTLVVSARLICSGSPSPDCNDRQSVNQRKHDIASLQDTSSVALNQLHHGLAASL